MVLQCVLRVRLVLELRLSPHGLAIPYLTSHQLTNSLRAYCYSSPVSFSSLLSSPMTCIFILSKGVRYTIVPIPNLFFFLLYSAAS